MIRPAELKDDDVWAMLCASRDGDVEEVKALGARRPELISCEYNYTPPLHFAVREGHLPVVQYLIEQGADPSYSSYPFGDSLLTIAGDREHHEVAEFLLKVPAKVLPVVEGSAEFLDAVRSGDYAQVKLMLDRDPALANFEDGQALWIAVYQRQPEMAKLLLEHGANPNTAPDSSGSALFQARGDEYLTRLLIEYGAEDKSGDLDQFQLKVGDNALDEVAEMLARDPGLLRNGSAFWGEGILAGPANRGRHEMIELLMSHGARVPDVTKWARYYYFKHYETAALLLKNGMNPNHMNWQRVTLLHDMAHEGNVAKARLLLDYGADINAVDEEYRSTPLGLAARWGNSEMVTLLLERGADPNKSAASWSTPLAWARKKCHEDIEQTLAAAGAR